MTRRIATIGIVCAMLAPVHAFAIPLETAVSTTQPAVGEPFELIVAGRMPAAVSVVANNYAEALSDWTWRQVTREAVVEHALKIVRERIELRADREGLYLVRPLRWVLQWPDGTTEIASANRRFIEVPPGVAANLDLRPEHPLRAVRRTPAEWLPWTFAGGVAALLALLVWLARRRRRPTVQDPFAQLVEACEELVRRHGVLDKESAFRLSEIARRYVEERTPLPALEWTGQELRRAAVDWLTAQPGHRVWLDPLVREICALEDIKYRPPAEPEAALAEAVHRVEELARQAESLVTSQAGSDGEGR